MINVRYCQALSAHWQECWAAQSTGKDQCKVLSGQPPAPIAARECWAALSRAARILNLEMVIILGAIL